MIYEFCEESNIDVLKNFFNTEYPDSTFLDYNFSNDKLIHLYNGICDVDITITEGDFLYVTHKKSSRIYNINNFSEKSYYVKGFVDIMNELKIFIRDYKLNTIL